MSLTVYKIIIICTFLAFDSWCETWTFSAFKIAPEHVWGLSLHILMISLVSPSDVQHPEPQRTPGPAAHHARAAHQHGGPDAGQTRITNTSSAPVTHLSDSLSLFFSLWTLAHTQNTPIVQHAFISDTQIHDRNAFLMHLLLLFSYDKKHDWSVLVYRVLMFRFCPTANPRFYDAFQICLLFSHTGAVLDKNTIF